MVPEASVTMADRMGWAPLLMAARLGASGASAGTSQGAAPRAGAADARGLLCRERAMGTKASTATPAERASVRPAAAAPRPAAEAAR